MFGGNQQGGGGNDFVFLTGLFASKSGKSITGVVKPDSFNTLFKLMQEADAKGTGLLVVVSGPGENAGRMQGRLSVAVARPQQQGGFQPQSAPAGPFGGGPVNQAQPKVQQQATAAPAFGANIGQTKANNPPKDDLESFLEGFDKA